jgi:iron complex outermembrane receptor protein
VQARWPVLVGLLGLVAVTRAAAASPRGGDEPAALAELGDVEDVEALSLGELLERPVVAAARYAQHPGDAPTLVSTVDAEDLERFAYRTVADALHGVRGAYVTSDRTYTYLGLRGISIPGDYGTRIATSIDGHRINDPVYGQGTTGLELGMPLIAIDHVELIRGGAWSVYGQNALLGAVQIISASGASRPGLRVTTTTRASAETYGDPSGHGALGWRGQDVAASYGAVGHGFDVFAAATYLFDPGLAASYTPAFDDPSQTCLDPAQRPRPCDGIVRGGDGEEAGSAYLVVRGRGLAVHALASRRRKRDPTAPYGDIIGDTTDTTFDDRLYADVEYTHRRAHDDVVARVALDSYGFHGLLAYDTPRPGYLTLPSSRVVNDDQAQGRGVLAEVRYHRRIARLGRHVRDLELVVGAEAGLASAHQYNADLFPEGTKVAFDRRDPDRGGAIYGQASARLFERVVGFAAVRADERVDSFGLTVNPQGGVVVDAGALGLVRATLARGFRAPSAYERFYGAFNAALGPEHSDTGEVSLERYLGSHTRIRLIGYVQRLRDVIELQRTAANEVRFMNAVHIDARGLEAELEGKWDDVRVRASLARQLAEDEDDGVLANSPRSVAYASVLTPLFGDRARLAIETSYLGSRASPLGPTLPPVFLSNANLVIPDVARGLDLVVGANNLFDERGGDPGSADHRQAVIPRDPRTIWLRLQLEPGR